MYGHCINTAGTCYAEFNSSDHSNNEVRPKLTINYTAVSEIEPENEVQSINNILLYNYPNPFNPTTTIQFSNEQNQQNEQLKIEIYNIKGQKVKTLESITWNGTDDNNEPVSSGIYFYQLRIDGNSKATNRMILMK
ncbi:MAG: T9SS type A sorting domain-containing protein [Candidatus Cloacimonetes bacterium]|nr:T9SS type A sorting domain-containing protein [Candidatus Cloacimonadota bacterium]